MSIQSTETAGSVETAALAKGAAAVAAATGAQVVESSAHIFELTPGNIASWLATIFVFCQLSEWWWKRVWRPLFERRGWIKPKKRRGFSESEIAKLLSDGPDKG